MGVPSFYRHPASCSPQDFNALRSVDLVLECVDEDLTLKIDILRRLERVCGSETILCTSTASLDTVALAQPLRRPYSVSRCVIVDCVCVCVSSRY